MRDGYGGLQEVHQRHRLSRLLRSVLFGNGNQPLSALQRPSDRLRLLFRANDLRAVRRRVLPFGRRLSQLFRRHRRLSHLQQFGPLLLVCPQHSLSQRDVEPLRFVSHRLSELSQLQLDGVPSLSVFLFPQLGRLPKVFPKLLPLRFLGLNLHRLRPRLLPFRPFVSALRPSVLSLLVRSQLSQLCFRTLSQRLTLRCLRASVFPLRHFGLKLFVL